MPADARAPQPSPQRPPRPLAPVAAVPSDADDDGGGDQDATDHDDELTTRTFDKDDD